MNLQNKMIDLRQIGQERRRQRRDFVGVEVELAEKRETLLESAGAGRHFEIFTKRLPIEINLSYHDLCKGVSS